MPRTRWCLFLLFSACAHRPPVVNVPSESGRRATGHVELSVMSAEIRPEGLTESERASLRAQSLRRTGSANPLSVAIGALSYGKEVVDQAASALKPKAIIVLDGDEERESEIGEGATPTWAKLTYGPIVFGPDSNMRIGIVDTTLGGLMKDKLLGICTMQGVPLVDEQNYVRPESMRCLGRVMTVALRVRSVDLTPHPEAGADEPATNP